MLTDDTKIKHSNITSLIIIYIYKCWTWLRFCHNARWRHPSRRRVGRYVRFQGKNGKNSLVSASQMCFLRPEWISLGFGMLFRQNKTFKYVIILKFIHIAFIKTKQLLNSLNTSIEVSWFLTLHWIWGIFSALEMK